MTEKAFGKMFLLQIRHLGLVMASHGTSGDDQKDDVVGAVFMLTSAGASFTV